MKNVEPAQTSAPTTQKSTIVVPEKAAKIYALWQKINAIGNELIELEPLPAEIQAFNGFQNAVKEMYISELESVDLSEFV